ncbi:MAG: AbrB/MazE/SpoVT family DNA-binding domain-containing protein [Ignavibacteriae bacterium]|nr:AbrB/MazE/SpoVT family DNA-binding domain-containing protein [Ignavibacteriota bacterium]
MKTKVIKIGNSLGIRIPKPLLKQCEIESEVEIEESSRLLIIKPIRKKVRRGWDENFEQMTQNKDDTLIDTDTILLNDFDKDEWEW